MQNQRSSRRIVLSGLSPHIKGLQWEATEVLRIGRQPNSEILLNEASVSGQHAEVVAQGRGWILRDKGSAQGTFLNGVRVAKQQNLQLEDVIHCGPHSFKVTVLEEGPPPTLMQPRTEQPNIKTSGLLVKVQAVTRRSWEQGLEDLSQDNLCLTKGKQFLTFLRAGYHLSRIASLKEMLQAILDDTVTVFNAQHGTILLMDETRGELMPFAHCSFQNQKSSSSFSNTLAKRCFSKGESLLCGDVSNNLDLNRSQSLAEGRMSSIICALLRSPRKRLGIIHLDRGSKQEPFSEEELHLTDALAANVSVGIECALLVEKHREPFFEKLTAFVARTIELRDPHTGKHNQRVQTYAMLLAEELSLHPEERQQLRVGAGLHDLGKIVIDDATLHKPDKLTPEEYDRMKQLTLKGVALAEIFPDLLPIIPIIRSHHERWDGTGYPDGLSGESIPRLARIAAIANAFDTMTSDQTYRPALSLPDAFAELQAGAGTQFDPELVRTFLCLRSRLEPLLTKVALGGNTCD